MVELVMDWIMQAAVGIQWELFENVGMLAMEWPSLGMKLYPAYVAISSMRRATIMLTINNY